jgi:hypothetical protein
MDVSDMSVGNIVVIVVGRNLSVPPCRVKTNGR